MPQAPFPWVFPYVEDPTGTRLGRDVLRPALSVTVAGARDAVRVLALVDSGCEHVLAAPWLERATGIQSDPDRMIPLGIGGSTRQVQFGVGRLRLCPPGADDSQHVEWECEIGFVREWRATWQVVLGQVGFFDRFTVTMHRAAQATVVEAWDTFDDRFGVRVEEAGPPPRLRSW